MMRRWQQAFRNWEFLELLNSGDENERDRSSARLGRLAWNRGVTLRALLVSTAKIHDCRSAIDSGCVARQSTSKR